MRRPVAGSMCARLFGTDHHRRLGVGGGSSPGGFDVVTCTDHADHANHFDRADHANRFDECGCRRAVSRGGERAGRAQRAGNTDRTAKHRQREH